jgi:hypothetical protein
VEIEKAKKKILAKKGGDEGQVTFCRKEIFMDNTDLGCESDPVFASTFRMFVQIIIEILRWV